MRKYRSILSVIFFFLYMSAIAALTVARGGEKYHGWEVDDEREIEQGYLIMDKKPGITAVEPTKGGGIVVSPFAIQVENIIFEYVSYDDLIFVPDDGVPSMVLVFGKGSVVSTLYMDSDAKRVLDSSDHSNVEIVGVTSLKVKKSDIKKATETNPGVYAVDVTDTGGDKNIKTAIDGELMTGSKVVYPQIAGSGTPAKGATVIIKESKDISFFEIRSMNDFLLWINLKFSMNLNNEEKKIFREGILTALEKTVEDNTAGAPGIKTVAGQVTSENTCVAVG